MPFQLSADLLYSILPSVLPAFSMGMLETSVLTSEVTMLQGFCPSFHNKDNSCMQTTTANVSGAGSLYACTSSAADAETRPRGGWATSTHTALPEHDMVWEWDMEVFIELQYACTGKRDGMPYNTEGKKWAIGNAAWNGWGMIDWNKHLTPDGSYQVADIYRFPSKLCLMVSIFLGVITSIGLTGGAFSLYRMVIKQYRLDVMLADPFLRPKIMRILALSNELFAKDAEQICAQKATELRHERQGKLEESGLTQRRRAEIEDLIERHTELAPKDMEDIETAKQILTECQRQLDLNDNELAEKRSWDLGFETDGQTRVSLANLVTDDWIHRLETMVTEVEYVWGVCLNNAASAQITPEPQQEELVTQLKDLCWHAAQDLRNLQTISVPFFLEMMMPNVQAIRQEIPSNIAQYLEIMHSSWQAELGVVIIQVITATFPALAFIIFNHWNVGVEQQLWYGQNGYHVTNSSYSCLGAVFVIVLNNYVMIAYHNGTLTGAEKPWSLESCCPREKARAEQNAKPQNKYCYFLGIEFGWDVKPEHGKMYVSLASDITGYTTTTTNYVRFARLRKSLLGGNVGIFFLSLFWFIFYITLGFQWSILGTFLYPEMTFPYAVAGSCFIGHAVATYQSLMQLYDKLKHAILEGIHRLAEAGRKGAADENSNSSKSADQASKPQEVHVSNRVEAFTFDPVVPWYDFERRIEKTAVRHSNAAVAHATTLNEVRQLLNSYNISEMTILGVVVYSSILLLALLAFITLGYWSISRGEVTEAGAAISSSFMIFMTAIINRNTVWCVPKIGAGYADSSVFAMLVDSFVEAWKQKQFENDGSGQFIYNDEGEAADVLKKAEKYYSERDVQLASMQNE